MLFDFDQASLKPAAKGALLNVVTVLRSYPAARVRVEGHTDGKGADAYNQGLSEKRAAAVAAFLGARSGLVPGRIVTRGFGRTRPVAPNARSDGSDDPEGRARNRRVEIVVTKGD